MDLDSKKEVIDQLQITLNHLIKEIPQTDDIFFTEDRKVDYWELKTYIETKVRTEYSRHVLTIQLLIQKIQQLRDEIYRYELPDSSPAEQLARSAINHADELLVEFNKYEKELTSYKKETQKFVQEVYREITELRQENKTLQKRIQKLEENFYQPITLPSNIKIKPRQK